MAILDIFEQAKTEILALPYPLQLWMRWINIAFLLGVIFVKSHATARWALIAYILCFPVAILAYFFVRDIAMTGLPHLVFWIPLLVYIFRREFREPGFNPMSLYGIWLVLLSVTIAIVIALDTAAIYRVAFL